MKRLVKGLINLMVCLVITLLILIPIGNILQPKRVTQDTDIQTLITKGFYGEEEDSLDYLLIGDSDLYRGVSPIVMWDEYGIASYVYGSPSQRSYISYYFLKDALRKQKPKVVLLNVDTMFAKHKPKRGNVIEAFDDMKGYSIKLSATFDKDFPIDLTERYIFLFKAIRYHDRYRDLNKNDFEYAFGDVHYPYKGFNVSFVSKPANENNLDYMNRIDNIEMIPLYKDYLDKIYDLCKEEGIELRLLEVPSYDTWTYEKSNIIMEYANEKGIKFYDLNVPEVGLNWYTDSKDHGNHLNVYGATKVSKYLGAILSQDDNYINRKNDSKYKYWNEDSKDYHNFVDQKLIEYENKYQETE